MRNYYPKDYDYLGNAASATDCTGLIPSGTVEETELMYYQDLLHFGGVPVLRPPREYDLEIFPHSLR